ncbi:MAG: CAP domain-containing protein [Proteobacteria bacterium]|nr:CAP domain-containing protein [Pseudomonadota bacterium]
MLLILVGCFGPTEWTDVHVDDFCEPSSPYDGAPEASVQAVERANCHRLLAGLDAGELDVSLDDASLAHALYMAEHAELTHYEDASKSGYTGDAVWDRIETAGWSQTMGVTISEVVAFGDGPTGAVDTWVHSVYHREPFLTPEWINTGFGIEGMYTAMAFVGAYPQVQEQVVPYPVNGQTGVPTTFDSDTESPDPAPDHGLVGYPVTVTIGSASPEPEVRLLRGELRGPSGKVETLALDPSNDDALGNMVALVPLAPLEAASGYDAELTVEWSGGEETVLVHFETE